MVKSILKLNYEIIIVMWWTKKEENYNEFIEDWWNVKIDEINFTRLIGGFGKDNPTITDKQIGELLGYVHGARQVREIINDNIQHFNDVHIIDLQRDGRNDSNVEVLKSLGYAPQSIKQANNIYILSHAGFLLYLKFANGDRSVELYKNFIEDYFKTKAENKIMKETNHNQIKALSDGKYKLYGMAIMERDEIKKCNSYHHLRILI